ncbi:MAG: hypothetical protein ABIJ31_07095 [Pseudomonadota bacterium]
MDKKKIRFYYGVVLIVVGLAVFYRIPQVIPQIETIEFFRQKILVVKFCFYTLGVFLIAAGSIRIYKNY